MKTACVYSTTAYSIASVIPAQNIQEHWVRVQADFLAPHKEWDVWRMHQYILEVRSGESVIKSRFVRVDRMLDDGKTHTIFFDCKLPEEPFTELRIFCWNAGSDKPLYIDNLHVFSFD
ncbi:MAG: hypothetical protein R2794_06330 [Chitinophagales bacterium]